MHGRGGENRKRSRRHMWSVPTTLKRTVAGNSKSSSVDYFYKDGRKISIGDSALFKPPQDSPPFIGIIRWLALNEENNLQLGVNWLYRPTEVKFGKGILLDSEPNELFYSFHKDEIPAASLLHPCKVAFLHKGVELPSGISSFICHRVYDIANKCLWWLTDQDYIDQRQEEVDQLLHKTQIEMHATVQPGGRSPKPINGPTSTSMLKPGSDIVQSSTSFPSQTKGKKRERADQGSEPIKRERSSKSDDDCGHFKPESILKSEISKIMEKGGLVDSEGVAKLVQLMQPDRAERKMDLITRSMLAGVVAATEKFDCLSRFVQLKGLSVLDEWLQDVHKGKIGGLSTKDGDKSVEEFLLVLLRALDKLPVNLHALQTCNIGKSVNHLRSHKNLEIQKKARSLVDTWKKRVEAEMNVIDAKSGSTQAVSWPSRSRLPEVSHGGNRHPGGSSEVATRSSVTQPSASKTASVKPVQGDLTSKSTSSSPGPMKSALSPASGKDGQPKILVGCTSDLPSTTAREERSSSSSQSHNNSQSCSSDHAKTTVFSGKEDARSSTAGSMSVNKMSGGSSRHRRSVNGFSGPAVSGGQRETVSSKSSSLHKNSASEKFCQSGLTCEKTLDVPIIEGNSHKLIVKIPNRGRSPAQTASGGSVDDPSIMNSRASSPVLSEKQDQSDRNSKEKSDANQANTTSDVNTESWQSNDLKDVLTGSDEGDGSPDTIAEEEPCRTGEEAAKLAEISRDTSSSIKALIESCVKYSEANASISAGDNVGMNLLASVAAGEMSNSDFSSPTDSPQRNTPIIEDSCTGTDAKSKPSLGINLSHEQSQSADGAVTGLEQGNGLHNLSKLDSGDFSGDGKITSSIPEQMPTGEGNEYNSSNLDLQPSVESCLGINKRIDELRGAASLASGTENVLDGEGSKQPHEKMETVSIASVDGIQDTKLKANSLLADDRVNEVPSSVEVGKAAIEGSLSYASLEINGDNKNNVNEGFNGGDDTEQKPPPGKVHCEHLERNEEERMHHSGSGKDMPSENVDELKGGKPDEMNSRSCSQFVKREIDRGTNSALTNGSLVLADLASAVSDHKSEGLEANTESKDLLDHSSGAVVLQKTGSPAQNVEQHTRSRGSKMNGLEANDTGESASVAADASFFPDARSSCTDMKLKFDLNEGFVANDEKYGDPVNLAGSGCSTSVHLVNALPFSVSSVSSGLPASITVAAAAKGPFVPPDDLLRSKGELGWKGSAATSAFRPAEPRKVVEIPLGATNIPLPDVAFGKHGRPLLDIDLNVPDERILEELASRNSAQETASTSDHASNRDAQNGLMCSSSIRSSGGLDLDLNQVDEASDLGLYSTNSSRRLEASLLPVKSSLLGGLPNAEVRRDFDLNNGPVLDEASAEPSSYSQHGRSNMQSQPPVSGLRMNNAETGTFSSWFTTGNTYPAVTIPSILSDRGEQPFPIIATGGPPRMLGHTSGGTPFTPDFYRGSVPFSSTPFQYPVLPFASTFPLPSANFSGGSTAYMDSSSGGRFCFPAVNSQLLGPPAAISPSQYHRPYVVSQPRHGLDLNAGPGSLDMEGRDETLPFASRQLSVVSSQALAEEQARIYQQVAGGVLKRKEPEGGWDVETFKYKQSPWP